MRLNKAVAVAEAAVATEDRNVNYLTLFVPAVVSTPRFLSSPTAPSLSIVVTATAAALLIRKRADGKK